MSFNLCTLLVSCFDSRKTTRIKGEGIDLLVSLLYSCYGLCQCDLVKMYCLVRGILSVYVIYPYDNPCYRNQGKE